MVLVCSFGSSTAWVRTSPVTFPSGAIEFFLPTNNFPLGKESSGGAGSLQNLHGFSRPFAPEKQPG